MIISFRLEGSLQSWGDHSKTTIKDTSAFPTKSGVVGLIACAMGLKRGDDKIAEISNSIKIVVRADRRGTIFNDYQNAHIFNYKNGLSKSDRTIQLYKDYIADGSFLVIVEANEKLLDEICEAFKHPVWSIYLGRKCCVPNVPVIATKYNYSISEALYKIPLAERFDVENDNKTPSIFYESDSDHGFWKNDDVLKRTNPYVARYARRLVIIQKLDPERLLEERKNETV